MSSEPHAPPAKTCRRVVACYSVLDCFMPACGFDDLTDGMYEGDPDRPYAAAQARQAEVLLDRAGCRAGGRLLDVGCGYGRILRAAQARRARATGVTVSPEQVRRCRRSGLDVHLLDYRNLDAAWDGRFDGVIANGSLEHFAQPADAAAGRDDDVYRHMFRTAHRVMDPASASGCFVTTAIHIRRRPDPNDWLRPPSAFPYGSDAFHWSRLTHAFGGWYPTPGQLARCARDFFELVHEEDGTADYHWTSEAWLRGVRRTLCSSRGLLVALQAVPVAVRHPVQLAALFRCQLGSESWNWQFRGDPPPTILLRHTWRRRPL